MPQNLIMRSQQWFKERFNVVIKMYVDMGNGGNDFISITSENALNNVMFCLFLASVYPVSGYCVVKLARWYPIWLMYWGTLFRVWWCIHPGPELLNGFYIKTRFSSILKSKLVDKDLQPDFGYAGGYAGSQYGPWFKWMKWPYSIQNLPRCVGNSGPRYSKAPACLVSQVPDVLMFRNCTGQKSLR